MIIRHPKLTPEGMSLMLEQAGLTVRKLSRQELAQRTGLKPNSVRALLAQLVREMREGSNLVHRGTAQRHTVIEEAYLEIKATSGTIPAGRTVTPARSESVAPHTPTASAPNSYEQHR